MDPAPATHLRGRLGEAIACLFLESRGYAIVARNLRVGRRELDIVAERGRLLIAIEVKWRRTEEAATAWRPAQRARAHEAVLGAMAMLPGAAERPWRFDFVTLEERADGLSLTHHRAAWSPGNRFW